MDLYKLGRVPWIDSQLIYHALPRVGREALVLCRPASPYVSIGYHQDLRFEVDVAYCRRHRIPVFRREVAGGTVYLDDRQLFYQLILHRRNPIVPRSPDRFFRTFLEPVVQTLAQWGLPARFVPPCDIHVGGRKISGNGAGDIADCVVLVGNLLLDFDCEQMANVLHLSGETLRGLVRRHMEQELTTVKRELGGIPRIAALEDALIESFAAVLPAFTPAPVDSQLGSELSHLAELFTSPDWLCEPGRRLPYREVKIAEGTYVYAIGPDLLGRPGELWLVVKHGEICEIRARGNGVSQTVRQWQTGGRFSVERLRRWAWTQARARARPEDGNQDGLLAAGAE